MTSDVQAKRHNDSDGERDNCLSPDGGDLSDFAVTHWRKLLSRRSVEQFEDVSSPTHGKSSENYTFEVGPCGRRPNLVVRRVVTHGLPPSIRKVASQWKERRRNMARCLKQHVSAMPQQARRLLSDRFTEICRGTVKRIETDVASSRAVLSETGNVPMRDRLKASLTQNNAILSQLPRSFCVTGLNLQGALMETEQREMAMVPADAFSDSSVSNLATDDAFGPSPRKKKKTTWDDGEPQEANRETIMWQSRPIEGDSLKVSFKRISSPSNNAEKTPIRYSPDKLVSTDTLVSIGRSEVERSHGEDEIFSIPTVVSCRVSLLDDRYGSRDREDVTIAPCPRNHSTVTVKQCFVDLGLPVTDDRVEGSAGKFHRDETLADTCARRASITGTGNDSYANVKHVVTTPSTSSNVGEAIKNSTDIISATICHVNDATAGRTAIQVGHVTPAKHSDNQVKRVTKASTKHADTRVSRVTKSPAILSDVHAGIITKSKANSSDTHADVKHVTKSKATGSDIHADVKHVTKSKAKSSDIHVDVKHVTKSKAKSSDIHVDVKHITKSKSKSSDIHTDVKHVTKSKATSSDIHAYVKHVTKSKVKGSDFLADVKHVTKSKATSSDILADVKHVTKSKTKSSDIHSDVEHVTKSKARSSDIHADVIHVTKSKTKSSDIHSDVKHVTKSKVTSSDILADVKHVTKSKTKSSDIHSDVEHVTKSKARSSDIHADVIHVTKSKTKSSDIHSDVEHVTKSKARSSDIHADVIHVTKSKTKSSDIHSDVKHVTKPKATSGDIHADVKRAAKASAAVSSTCEGVQHDSEPSTTMTDIHANIRDAMEVSATCSDIHAGVRHVTKPPSGHSQSDTRHVSRSLVACSDIYAGSKRDVRKGSKCIAESPASRSASLKRVIEVCSAGIGRVTKSQTTGDTKVASIDTFYRVNKIAALMTTESYLRVAQALSTAETAKTSRRRKTPDGCAKKSSRSSTSPHRHSETSKSSHRRSALCAGVTERTRSTSGKRRTTKRKSSGESGVRHRHVKAEETDATRLSLRDARKSCALPGIGGAIDEERLDVAHDKGLAAVRDTYSEPVFSTSEQPVFRHAEKLSSAKVPDKAGAIIRNTNSEPLFSTVEQPAFRDAERLNFAKVHEKFVFSTSEQAATKNAEKLNFAKVHDKAGAVIRNTNTEPLFSTVEQPAFSMDAQPRVCTSLSTFDTPVMVGPKQEVSVVAENERKLPDTTRWKSFGKEVELPENETKVPDTKSKAFGEEELPENERKLPDTTRWKSFGKEVELPENETKVPDTKSKAFGKEVELPENEGKLPATKWKEFGKEVALPENERKMPDAKWKAFGKEVELPKNDVEASVTELEGFWMELKSYTQQKLPEGVTVSREEHNEPRTDVKLPPIRVAQSETKLPGGEAKVQVAEVKVQNADMKVQDVKVELQEAALSPCVNASAAFYTDICQPDFTTSDNASLPRVGDKPSVIPSPHAGLAGKDGLKDIFANTSLYALQKQKLKDQSIEPSRSADLAAGFPVPSALIDRVVEACGVNLPTVSHVRVSLPARDSSKNGDTVSERGVQARRRVERENKHAVSQSEGKSERRQETASHKTTHPTKSSSTGKFHGRTLLSGAEVPVRMIPYKPLYLFHPIRQSGKLQEIPIDPRTAHYARRRNRLSSQKLTNLLDSLCHIGPESGDSSVSDDDQWHKTNVRRLWNTYSADDDSSAMSLTDSRKTEMRHGVASGNMEAESPHCGAHGAGIVVSRWGQRTKQPKPPRNGIGATSGSTRADSARL